MRKCRCNCGYSCGGPGRCVLSVTECLSQAEGHYERDCDHDFSGPLVELDELTASVVCQECGLSSMAHDMSRGP